MWNSGPREGPGQGPGPVRQDRAHGPAAHAEERKIFKGVSPNVDFYSGFVYDMLGIPMELYTPLFAVARIMGWSAHRIEELLSANKIIRPAYKSLGGTHDYIPRDAR